MDQAALRQLALQSVAATQRLLGRHGPHGAVVERPGWVAAVVPPLAEASLVNGVVLLDNAALQDALDRMADTYAGAGITRWGVLLYPDRATAAILAQSRLVPDTRPVAMAAHLADLALDDPPPPALPVDLAIVGRVNDQAYGHADERMERLIAELPSTVAHAYRADFEDEPTSVSLVIDHGDDAAVSFVATAPWAQNQGLARTVLSRALHDARARGQTTSTLIASRAGQALYRALGYRAVGTLELWEHRARS